jgi:hypothetical protein
MGNGSWGPGTVFEGAHVSGVGALGAFVLWELHGRGIPFTWDDCESAYNAWETSTGGILPYADDDPVWYAQGYRYWRDLAALAPGLAPYLEPVVTWFASKGRPMGVGAQVAPVQLRNGLSVWRDDRLGWQLNVQSLVGATRAAFVRARVDADQAEVDPRVAQIRCWGVQDTTLAFPAWGWALAMEVGPTPAGAPLWSSAPRVCLRFASRKRYLQPVSGYPTWWWAGSDRVYQRQPTALDEGALQAKVEAFVTQAAEVWGEVVTVTVGSGPAGQGWRPTPRFQQRRAGELLVCELGPRLYAPRPQGGNGIQCGPLAARRLVDQLFGPPPRQAV